MCQVTNRKESVQTSVRHADKQRYFYKLVYCFCPVDMIKAIIIEDEHLVARQLERKISLVANDISIIEILPSLKTARKWLMENAEPDLIFMDIQLSDGISFELFDYYDLKCAVIFTTAYDEYAIRAFKVNGIDYLLKPVGENELKKALEKCRRLIGNNPENTLAVQELIKALALPGAAQNKYKEKFIISVRHQWIPIETSNIACFSKDNIYYLHTFQGDRHALEYDSMDQLEDLLNSRQFYRANRQYLVNVDAIQAVRLHENQKLTVILKSPLKIEIDVSREKAPAFKKWFDR